MSGTDTHDTLRLLEADGAATGQVWQATLIQAGLSANQVYYADAVLREAVSRFDGARIYVKSDADHLKGASKDVRQLVGWVSQPRSAMRARRPTAAASRRPSTCPACPTISASC